MKTIQLKLTNCPTCGSEKIKQIRRNFQDAVHGQSYVVPNLEFHECPDCDEQVFDQAAMRKIESYSPTFAHLYPHKKAA